MNKKLNPREARALEQAQHIIARKRLGAPVSQQSLEAAQAVIREYGPCDLAPQHMESQIYHPAELMEG